MRAVMYHYVRPFDARMPYLKHLHLDDFKAQLDHFQETCGFVSYDAFMDSLITGELPEGVILTFDDGLICHYEHAFKELQSRGLWGIFYIPTGVYQTGKLLDVHRIHVLLGIIESQRIYEHLRSIITDDMLTDVGVEAFVNDTYTTQSNDAFSLEVKKILNYYISYEHREAVLDQLMHHFDLHGADTVEAFYINDGHIREMHENGMVIGSHTVSHPVLSKLSEAEQVHEIQASFEYLRTVCRDPQISTFCYPYGGFHTFTAATERILTEAGCRYSFNVEHRDINRNDLLLRPQALPRYDCNHFPYGQVR